MKLRNQSRPRKESQQHGRQIQQGNRNYEEKNK
jgi:hypothetical protein